MWLGFIAYPLSAAYTDPRIGLVHLAVVNLGAAGVCGAYIAYCALPDLTRDHLDRRLLAVLVAVIVGAVTVLVFYDRPEWAYSYVYCLWPAVMLAGGRPWAVPVVASVAVAAGAAAGLAVGNLLGVAIVVVGVGGSIYGITRLVAANETLRRAHAEAAAAAIAEERLRFARDLHELLGHSLSLIALKSQVACRLSTLRPDRAAQEMTEIEHITRQALQEVREAVGGYRRPTLAGELQAATRALAAAGIATHGIAAHDLVATTYLPGHVEAPLAWALREGVTNVIRHSRASTCTITLDTDNRAVTMTIADDGVGAASATDPQVCGHGLRGLAERVAAVGGSLTTGPNATGGFRLSASVPLPEGVPVSPPAVALPAGA